MCLSPTACTSVYKQNVTPKGCYFIIGQIEQCICLKHQVYIHVY